MIKYYCDRCDKPLKDEMVNILIKTTSKGGTKSEGKQFCIDCFYQIKFNVGNEKPKKKAENEEKSVKPLTASLEKFEVKDGNSDSSKKPEKKKLSDDELEEVLDNLSHVTRGVNPRVVKDEPKKIVIDNPAPYVERDIVVDDCKINVEQNLDLMRKLYDSIQDELPNKPGVKADIIGIRRALLYLYSGYPQSETARIINTDFQKIYQWKKKFACKPVLDRHFKIEGNKRTLSILSAYKTTGSVSAVSSTTGIGADEILKVIDYYTGITYHK